MAPAPQMRACVAGATGLVGRALLTRLAADARVLATTALVRQVATPGGLPASVTALQVDYAALANGSRLPPVDWAFCALGTTIKVAGSQAAFRAVDFDAVLAFAKAARAAGASRLGLVSAMGADVHSALFYNRVKGEVEQALSGQGWPHLVIARPSLLLGERQVLGQARRPVEAMAQALMPTLGWLMPGNLRPVAANDVAASLINALASSTGGVTTLLSGDLQGSSGRR